MKQFLKYFLACLFAIAAFIFIGFIILFAIGASSGGNKPSVDDNSVLVWDLSMPITDKEQPKNFAAALNGESSNSGGTIRQIAQCLTNAASDKKIKGLYLKLNGCNEGWATLQELKPYLDSFKKSGKFIVGYGDYIDQKAFYLTASSAKLYTHPMGGVDWKGLSATSMFFKNTLAKLDIQPQVFYDGKYKGASEQFRLDKFSDANRFQITELVNDFYRALLVAGAAKTGNDTTTLNGYAQTMAIKTANDALQAKMIDGIKYEIDVMNELKTLTGTKSDEDLNKISINKYIDVLPEPKYEKEKIAILYAEGEIVDGKNRDKVSTDVLVKQIREIADDEKIKALVLRVNSPGGSALASETMHYELSQLRKKMPIIISMGDVAASGGYYLSCSGDSIFAQSNTITGSIGVVGMMLNFQGFLNNKLGVTTDMVKTAPYADLPNATRALTDAETKIIQASLDSIYIRFKTRVANARKLSLDQVEALAQGRVYSGQDALAVGLVDKIGGLDRAIASAAVSAKLKNYRIVEYPQPEDQLQSFLHSLNGDEQEKVALQKYLGTDYTIYTQLQSLREKMNKGLCIMPFDLVIQ